jgi:hypothetical protein
MKAYPLMKLKVPHEWVCILCGEPVTQYHEDISAHQVRCNVELRIREIVRDELAKKNDEVA